MTWDPIQAEAVIQVRDDRDSHLDRVVVQVKDNRELPPCWNTFKREMTKTCIQAGAVFQVGKDRDSHPGGSHGLGGR